MPRKNPPSARGSRFLSLVLRHKPESIGLSLDAQGWANIDELIEAAQDRIKLTRERIEHIVRHNDKQRFTISEDGRKIRANQGHSFEVDLELEAETPPDSLFHGTPERFIESILTQGLTRQRRQHVHLSADAVTAIAVGKRRGEPVVLRINAKAMHDAGHRFFQSANGVWLVAAVPPEFITVEQDQSRSRRS